jgi:osmotically-inducible protein OsmY
VKGFLPLLLLALCAACTSTTTTEEVKRQIDSAASSAPVAAFKDGLIAAAIKAKLASDDIDSATRVHVAVKDGHERISGVRSMSRRATQKASPASDLSRT